MYWDDDDDLDNHHPTCKGPCGQLADECMCSWPPSYWYRDTNGVLNIYYNDEED